MKKAYWLVVFVLLTFSLIAVDFTMVSNCLPALRDFYSYWNYVPSNIVLSDILFIEGALLLAVGAIFAGFSLYTITYQAGDKLKYDYVKSGFNWEAIKKEHDIPSTLRIGLVLLGVGVACIVAAVVVTL